MPILERKIVPRRFDDGLHAVGMYETPEGCVCFPQDRTQNLCGQHVIKNGMIGGGVRLVVVYDLSFYEWHYGNEFAALKAELDEEAA